MPRGAKKDITVTKNLRESGCFKDPRSFTSLDGHLFLFGEDKANVRRRVFKKWKNKCVICKHELSEFADDWSRLKGDWHHPKNCDCVGCSELRCGTTTGRPCHAHRTVGFKRKAAPEAL